MDEMQQYEDEDWSMLRAIVVNVLLELIET